MDGRVLLFTFGTCVLTGIAFGLIPAYRAVRTNLKERLQERGRSTATISRHRTRNTLVVIEIALALVLLIFRTDDQPADTRLAYSSGLRSRASADGGSSPDRR